jgi:hypothetical protein
MEKLLQTIPKSLRQVAVAIQVPANLATLTLEDASGRLRAAQEAGAEDDAPPPRSDGKLCLTRKQWEAQEEKEKHRHFDAGGSAHKSGDRRGKARRGHPSGDERTGLERKLGINQCRRCLKTGHWACECPTKPKKSEAKVAQTEEEGPALFCTAASVNAEPAVRFDAVDLVEAKVFAQLDGDGSGECGYFDTGATNHMTGAREAFTELNTSMRGTVRFGDGFVVTIEGRGSILFEARTGEHQRLSMCTTSRGHGEHREPWATRRRGMSRAHRPQGAADLGREASPDRPGEVVHDAPVPAPAEACQAGLPRCPAQRRGMELA